MRIKLKKYKKLERRNVRKFLFLPMRISDCIVWLELVTIEQVFDGQKWNNKRLM